MQASPSHKQGPPPRRAAFTLVELLVSTAVIAVLLIMLAQVSGVVGDTWSQVQGRAERRQHGRALVDQIGRELRAATLPVDGLAGRDTANLQFVMNPPGLGASFKHPHALFWQAPVATDASRGDMAIVGYFVKWDTSGDATRARLCRLFLNPGEAGHRIYERGGADRWMTDELLNTLAPADREHAYRGLFAENVIGLWTRCLDGQGNVIQNVAGGGYDSRLDYTAQSWTNVTVMHRAPVLPYSVEVSLVLLDSRAAEAVKPALQPALAGLVSQSQHAEDCLLRLQSSTLPRAVISGATAHVLRVRLENGP